MLTKPSHHHLQYVTKESFPMNHLIYSEYLDKHAVMNEVESISWTQAVKKALGKKSCQLHRAPLPAISIRARIISSINRYGSFCFVFYVSLFIAAITIIAVVYDYCSRMAPTTTVSFDGTTVALQTFCQRENASQKKRARVGKCIGYISKYNAIYCADMGTPCLRILITVQEKMQNRLL